ncbi:MAG: haloalkane dehalogenase [Burkholderiaceae bacterium]
MQVLRTPDDRFDNLPDWSYEPNYVSDLAGAEGMRVHYVDEGDADAEVTYLCLHGEPTWAYLFRKMIPVLTAAGGRVVAPDWLGFGRSDKPVDDETYGFHFHRDMMLAFVERLDLSNITLVVQDWGGLLGLTLPHAMPERFTRLIIMNTALATGTAPSKGFLAWQAYANANPDLDVGALMKRSTPGMSDAEAAAYAAPFPSAAFKAGVRRFPQMVMTNPEMEGVETSRQALEFWQKQWAGQTFMAVGKQDPVLGVEVMQGMASMIKGCPAPFIIEPAGHFVQEWGDIVATEALKSFAEHA